MPVASRVYRIHLHHTLFSVGSLLNKRVDTLIFKSFFQADTLIRVSFNTYQSRFDIDIDVKTALIGVKTGPNKRICLGNV